MKRITVYHIYTLLMPCTVLSFLSVLIFWLPPDSDEKITLGVTILLAFFVNSLVVSNYTPEAAAELPVIAIYYTFNILIVALSLSVSVFILNLHFRGHKKNRIPEWTKRLFRLKNDHYLKQRSNSTIVVLNKLNKKLDSTEISTKSNISSTSCKLGEEATYTKEAKILRKLFKIVKLLVVKFEQDKLRETHQENINIEWKELARRIEFIFLAFSLILIILTPIFLFGKFIQRDFITHEHLKKPCGCVNSFVTNV
jgi:hypothetical protein